MNILIVDDEHLARERLKQMVTTLHGFIVAGEAANGFDALEMFQALQPEIVLMDIRMPGMDGLEAGRHLSSMSRPPAIIFTTAYGEYALRAFEAHAVDYLLKPVRKEKLEQALLAARKLSRAQLEGITQARTDGRSHISARVRGDIKLVPVEKIFYFKADAKYVVVRHTEGELLIEESLKSLEQELDDRFMRVHRNALVAVPLLNGLKKTSTGHIQLQFDGIDDTVEVSRRHLPQVRNLFR
ncbi:MAG: response regulator transcription factor [Gammaproteobacteria bacterium]|nr:MAG: response regulator transcription factor [Gammaproteobacteria bacterium]